jgi:hypothetical protein
MCAPPSGRAPDGPNCRKAIATGKRAENFAISEKGRLGGNNALWEPEPAICPFPSPRFARAQVKRVGLTNTSSCFPMGSARKWHKETSLWAN